MPTGFGGHAQSYCIIGPTTWPPSRAELVHFVFGQANRSLSQNHFCNRAISRHASNLSFKRFLLWSYDRKLSPSECFLKTTNIDVADFMEKLAYLGCSVPKSTASSLAWWVKFLDVPASFSLTASVIMAEIKSSRKDHDAKGVVQAKPFQLCHMRQVESVCVRATNPVHSALAAWDALLAHAVLRAEDSQRLKVGSCGFTDVVVHGICRNPKPRGVSNMPWSQHGCKAFVATSSSETCRRQPHVRSPSASENRFSKCGTSAQAAVFQVHS